jgi:hypothetical protein
MANAAVSARADAGTGTNFGANTEAKKSRAPLVAALCLLGVLLGGALLFLTHKSPVIESAPENPSGTPVAAAPAPNAARPTPPVVEPQPVATPEAPVVSAVAVASASGSPRTKAPIKAKAVSAKSKGATPPSAVPAVDPLDGRR